MDKTVSASVPEEDYLEIKNMAEQEGESVSGLIKNLLKREMSGAESGEKEDPPLAKKIEEVITLLKTPMIGELAPKSAEILNTIGSTLGELKVEIGRIQGLGGGSVSFKNPEFWKKSLAVVGIWSLIFSGAAGWGAWKIYERGTLDAGVAGEALASPVYQSFDHLMQCDQPGWTWEWDKNRKKVYCNIGPNPLTGKPYKLRIR